MSVLSYKDIQNFAKTINTTNIPKKNAYSMTGTVTELQSAEAYKEDDENVETLKLANVQIDGGDVCRASYDGMEVQVGDRVVVSIEDGKATITENYTNPNGNLLLSAEHGVPKEITDPDTDNTETIAYHMVLKKDGNNPYYYGVMKREDLPVPDGYIITGIKSIQLYYSLKTQGNVWTPYEVCKENLSAYIHLNGWTFNGNSLEIRYGAQAPDTASLQANYRFRASVVYTFIKADETNEQNS